VYNREPAGCWFSINLVNTLLCQPLTPTDLPQVLVLDQRCFGGFWSQSAYQRELESPNSDLLGLFWQQPDPPTTLVGLGCAWAILDEAHITLLGIDPDYQRQGLGQWLLLHLLQAACDRQLTHATLEVRPSNQRALSLYTQLGFAVAGTRPHYYADDEDALILWKSGLQTPDFATRLSQLITQQRALLQARGWQVRSQDPSVASPQLRLPQEKIKRKQ
jgi:ribosomal-protein-alanine N-acetyltransferase